jgi:hypothetical protein
MAVVKVNVYKEEVGYEDRRSAVTVGLSAKAERKVFAEKFKFEPESKRHCGKRTFFHDSSSFAFNILIGKHCHAVSCQPSTVL